MLSTIDRNYINKPLKAFQPLTLVEGNIPEFTREGYLSTVYLEDMETEEEKEIYNYFEAIDRELPW